MSNNEFINGHLKYINDIGKSFDGRLMQAHVSFSTNASFNNIYVYVAPAAQTLLDNGDVVYTNQ